MPEVSIKELLEAGSHFGHQVSRWNPRMRPYIFSVKGGIHILDLEQTAHFLRKACRFISDTVALGQSVLFVGTKKQAKQVILEEATRVGQFHVTNRWLGGLMTNFKTIKASIERMEGLEKQAASPEFEKYTKKERLDVTRQIEKLNSVLGGIKTMQRLPGCLFIVDPKTEDIARKEAQRLKIPIVAVLDTNCDPKGIDYLIPANDDALRSIQLITKAISGACEEGLARREAALASEKENGAAKEEGVVKSSPAISERQMPEKGRAYVGKKKKGEEDTIEEDLEKFAKAKANVVEGEKT